MAWHDSGTYDRTIKSFPSCGGANGSIRFKKELSHGANAGLKKAINFLKPFKEKYPTISWADLIQLASVTAIDHSGGGWIPIKFGRIDTINENECPPEGNLPSANGPFPDGSTDAAIHLRRIFYRMGFNDKEIVILSGAHTLGRAFKERSGTTENSYGRRGATKYTNDKLNRPRHDGGKGVGMPGGKSWTKNWLSFNNEYYKKDGKDKELLNLSTDKILFIDPIFKKYVEEYGKDQNSFFRDYAKAHVKLSQLGSQFRPPQGFYL